MSLNIHIYSIYQDLDDIFKNESSMSYLFGKVSGICFPPKNTKKKRRGDCSSHSNGFTQLPVVVTSSSKFLLWNLAVFCLISYGHEANHSSIEILGPSWCTFGRTPLGPMSPPSWSKTYGEFAWRNWGIFGRYIHDRCCIINWMDVEP